MEQITLPIYSTDGKEVDSVKLDPAVFDGAINAAAMHQVIVAYQANQRKGLAATKTRGEVSGGGRKPWKQKGTGRARVGSTRSPLWRHGGVIFGPHPRDFSYTIPQKLKALALKSSLNAKLKENDFIVLDNFKVEKAKTKEAAKIFANLKLSPTKNQRQLKILLILNKMDDSLSRSLRNIGFLGFNLAKDACAYEVLASQKLLITREALSELTQRLSPVRNTAFSNREDKISNGVKK